MLVRLDVQVLSAHGAETRAVGAAEDLLGKSQADRVSRPGSDLESVIRDIVGAKDVRGGRRRIVELSCLRPDVHLREPETPHARPRETDMQAKVEHRGAGGLRDLHVDRNRLGVGFVALAAEQERVELDIDTFLADLPWPKPQSAKVDRAHSRSVAPPEPPDEPLAPVVGC
jgi:hypothetical protein